MDVGYKRFAGDMSIFLNGIREQVKGFMNGDQLLRIVERYIRKSDPGITDIKITRIADRQTMFVEQVDEESGGRAVMMSEYQIDGTTCWAGYSLRSGTIYISMVS
jgi:hypothetical protein